MKKRNQNFSDAAILDIYKKAVCEWDQYKTWSNYPVYGHAFNVSNVANASNALAHLAKCEGLVELLESITVFHQGGGYSEKFNSTVFERLKSFESPMNELMKENQNASNQ